jgi:MFS family permease
VSPSEGIRPQTTAERYFRRNAALLMLEAAAFLAGLEFMGTGVVIPVLVSRLGGSDLLVGMFRFIHVLGFTLPALVAARLIHGRVYHKRFLLLSTLSGRVLLLTLPFVLPLGARYPSGVLAWLVFVWVLFWFSDGTCTVSWFDIVAKAVPLQRRGAFFGWMQTTTGLVGMGVGWAVGRVLSPGGLPFPANFALLSVGWCVGAWVSQALLCGIVEPPGEVDETDRPGMREYVSRLRPMLRTNHRLRRLIWARVLADGGSMALQFYVLFAAKVLSVSDSTLGFYTACLGVGKVVGGPVIAVCQHRLGSRGAFCVVAMLVAAVPTLGFAASMGAAGVMPLLFVVLGVVQDGLWIAFSQAVMAASNDAERPMAVGIASLCQVPGACFAPLGGVLTGVMGYRGVFLLTAVVTWCGVAAAVTGRRQNASGSV